MAVDLAADYQDHQCQLPGRRLRVRFEIDVASRRRVGSNLEYRSIHIRDGQIEQDVKRAA